MKSVLTRIAIGGLCAAALAPLPAAASSCEPLKGRLEQIVAMKEIHRKNAVNRRDLHNEINAQIYMLQPHAGDCGGEKKWCDLGAAQVERLEKVKAAVQRELDESSAKLQEATNEESYVRGEIGDCERKEQARKQADEKREAFDRSIRKREQVSRERAQRERNRTARDQAIAKQRWRDGVRRDRNRAARDQAVARDRWRDDMRRAQEAAAAAAAASAIIGIMGSGAVGGVGPTGGAMMGRRCHRNPYGGLHCL